MVKPLCLFALLALYLFAQCQAQAVNPDVIDFTKIDIWPDLRSCLKTTFGTCGFLGGCPGNVALEVGCQTNACLCRASTLGESVINAGNLAMGYCSNLDDKTSAVSILTQYCADKGYTSIVEPTILATPTGAFTVTVTEDSYTTATVTRYLSAAPTVKRDTTRAHSIFVFTFFVAIAMSTLLGIGLFWR